MTSPCLSITALLVTAAAAVAQPSTLSREHDPIVMEGGALPTLAGSPVGEIVAFRYLGGWVQIPVQIDECTIVDFGTAYGMDPIGITTMAYADATTYTGPDPVPGLDADDEVVFMAGDVGERVAPGAGVPDHVLAGGAVEVLVTDPLDGGEGYVYLFRSDGTLAPDAGRDDVAYTFDLLAGAYIPDYSIMSGPNPENSSAETARYRVHFSDRWIRDEMNVFAGGASGADILDRHKNMFGPGICQRTEDTFSAGEGAFLTNKDGCLRGIRSYLGANSGPLTQREHLFYAGREDVSTFLRVHPIPGVMDVFDYSPAAIEMAYHNDLNPAGVDVDGAPDLVTPGAITWEMVTGGQGTLMMALLIDTDIPGFAYTSYYSDDVTPAVTQCTGDAFEYATSGVWVDQAIPNTDPTQGAAYTMVSTRVVYYDAPGQTTDLAALRAEQAVVPLVAVAAPYASCPWDLDGDGAVGITDFLGLLAGWGEDPGGPPDFDGDGTVGINDFLIMLANWGPCP